MSLSEIANPAKIHLILVHILFFEISILNLLELRARVILSHQPFANLYNYFVRLLFRYLYVQVCSHPLYKEDMEHDQN